MGQLRLNGEDYLGLMGYATDAAAILCPGLEAGDILKVPVLNTKLYGTNLIGLFATGNRSGILVPYFIGDAELRRLRAFGKENGFTVSRIDTKYTALGNMIAANDKAAYVGSPLRADKQIADALGVEVVAGDIAGATEVGAYLCVTNQGLLAHPKAEGQLPELKELFGVDGMTGTVNRGVPYVRSGVIANSNGYVTGEQTTGIELQRIDDALGFF